MANILPAKTKYRKVQKGRNRGMAKGGDSIDFGDYAIQALERGKCSASQLEAARVAINRHFKRRGKVWMRVFPQKSVTKKPAKPAWVKVRAVSNSGAQSSSPARFSSKYPAYPPAWPAKR